MIFVKKPETEYLIDLVTYDLSELRSISRDKRINEIYILISNLFKIIIGKDYELTFEEALLILLQRKIVTDDIYTQLKQALVKLSFLKYGNHNYEFQDELFNDIEKVVLSFTAELVKNRNEDELVSLYEELRALNSSIKSVKTKIDLTKGYKEDLMKTEKEVEKEFLEKTKQKLEVKSDVKSDVKGEIAPTSRTYNKIDNNDFNDLLSDINSNPSNLSINKASKLDSEFNYYSSSLLEQKKDEIKNRILPILLKKKNKKNLYLKKNENIPFSFDELFNISTNLNLDKLLNFNFTGEEWIQTIWDLSVKYCMMSGKNKEEIISYYSNTDDVNLNVLKEALSNNKDYIKQTRDYVNTQRIIMAILYLTLSIIKGEDISNKIKCLKNNKLPLNHLNFIISNIFTNIDLN
jgi:hypothetical protein